MELEIHHYTIEGILKSATYLSVAVTYTSSVNLFTRRSVIMRWDVLQLEYMASSVTVQLHVSGRPWSASKTWQN